MTEEQYTKVLPYKDVCNLFAKTGSYIGGADGLLQLYGDMFNMGKRVDTSCMNCIIAVLLDINNKIEDYEGNMPSM